MEKIKKMDTLWRSLNDTLPPRRIQLVHDILWAFKNNCISENLASIFIRMLLFDRPYLLNLYDATMQSDKVKSYDISFEDIISMYEHNYSPLRNSNNQV